MNKVLVTGLGVGNSFGICETCSLDYSWLIYNPSTLIWADKLFIMRNSWEEQKKSQDKENKGINIVLDIAYDNGLIELIDAKEIFQEKVADEIMCEVASDTKRLRELFPDSIRKGDEGVPDEIIVDGIHFCAPKIASLYGSLKIAKELGANSLLSQSYYEYLKYKCGLDLDLSNRATIINEIMSVYLPNELVLHNYAFTTSNKCDACLKKESCQSTYLDEIEKNTKKILQWRDYDEIGRAKEELEKIIDLKNTFSEKIDIADIKRSYEEKQATINKKIKKIFPKIKRWSSLMTTIAIPATIYSTYTGNMLTAGFSASFLGISEIAKQYIDRFENRNAWVGFINNTKSTT